MRKQLSTAFIGVSTLILLVSIFRYEPPIGSSVQQVQRPQDWSGQKCPPGKRWNGNAGKRLCE
jgi:hypothetical protein